MAQIFEVYADEAWTHSAAASCEENRYWRFFGGVFGSHGAMDHLEKKLRQVSQTHGLKKEVGWKNIFSGNIDCYKLLVECFFDHLHSTDIKYRQIFLDRKYIHVPYDGASSAAVEVQFKLYYQFLKHSFGLSHIPHQGAEVRFILDNHSHQQHMDKLRSFVESLPFNLGRPDLTFSLSYKQSSKVARIQICDLLMGAAGFYGNKHYLRRRPGTRGMTEKQRLRFELAKLVYNKLRTCDAIFRGSNAFNWFESTGIGLESTNSFNHKIRIWKFVPQRHKIDKGWENDNLDRQGRYVAPQISEEVYHK